MKPLKVLIWNLQDFFIFLDKYQQEDLAQMTEPKWQLLTSSFKPNKELYKIKAIADFISHLSPDICLFTEVGGQESLQNFSTYFLNNQFTVHSESTNSDRGIDLGIMVSNNREFDYKCKLYKEAVYARGVYHLQVSQEDRQGHFLLTHLKSKLSKQHDFEGRTQRHREVDALIKRYQKVEQISDQPIFICGDLNGIIYRDQSEPELAQIANKLGLKDVFDLLDRDYFERSSYLYYNTVGDAHLMQLDYCLTHPKWTDLIGQASEVLDFDGKKRVSLPSSKNVKLQQPSDHYPLYIEIDLNKVQNIK